MCIFCFLSYSYDFIKIIAKYYYTNYKPNQQWVRRQNQSKG